MNNLFIWIPKTGGTSIYNALNKKMDMQLYTDNYTAFDNIGNVSFGHADVSSLLQKQIVTKEYWQSCYKFTVVRNPYSRFISLYNDFRQSKRIPVDTTLKEFASVIEHFTRKPGLFNVMDYSQAASQVNWILPGVEVLRFECISSFCEQHENKGTLDYWLDYYTPETLKMVTDIYYDDLTLLNYEILTDAE